MKTQTERILNILRIVAWIGYYGSLIAFGFGLILTFFSILEPNFLLKATLKIQGMDISLEKFREKHGFHAFFYASLFLINIFFILKIWELAKYALSIINLNQPFTFRISSILEKIAYYMSSIWVLSLIGMAYGAYLENLIEHKTRINFSIEFPYLFAAGIIYLISQIFKRGVEIQAENELTV